MAFLFKSFFISFCHLFCVLILIQRADTFGIQSTTLRNLQPSGNADFEERLTRIESSQNYIRTRIPRWESVMDSLLRRVEHVESAFGQFDKVWEERWDRLESIVAWSRTDPATPTGSSSSGSALHDDSVAVSRIEALNADVFTAMDELFEKIMRLEERIGQHDRKAEQQLDRLISLTNSQLEMTASFRTETSMDWRRAGRLLDTKLTHIATKIESGFHQMSIKNRCNASSRRRLQVDDEGTSERKLPHSDRPASPSRSEVNATAQAAPRYSDYFGSKVTNMFDELWRQGKLIAEDVANVTLKVNSIKWNMDEGFRTIIHRPQPQPTPCDELRVPAIMDTATKEYSSILSKHLDAVEARLNVNYEALRSSQTRLYERCSHDEEGHWARMVSYVIEKLVQTVRNKSQTTQDALNRLHGLVEQQNEKLLQVEQHYIKMEEEEVTVLRHRHSDAQEDVKAVKATVKSDDDDEEDKLVDTTDYSFED